ncbi:tetratricopeptide repeat protein [Thermodesulfobacteriota bacterium]
MGQRTLKIRSDSVQGDQSAKRETCPTVLKTGNAASSLVNNDVVFRRAPGMAPYAVPLPYSLTRQGALASETGWWRLTETVRWFMLTAFVITWACLMNGGCAPKVVKPSEDLLGFNEIFDKSQSDEKQDPDEEEDDWKEKGLRLAKDKEYDQAIEAFQQYVVKNPEDFFGFNALAVCYKSLGNFSQAMTNYERALEFTQSPEQEAKVRANIGNLQFAAKKLRSALGSYEEAARIFEANPYYLVLIAHTRITMGEYKRATKVLESVPDIERALEKYDQPEDRGMGLYLLAKCYIALGEKEKVVRSLERALKANPDRFVGRLKQDVENEGTVFYTLRDDDKIKKLLTKYVDFTSPGLWLNQD